MDRDAVWDGDSGWPQFRLVAQWTTVSTARFRKFLNAILAIELLTLNFCRKKRV